MRIEMAWGVGDLAGSADLYGALGLTPDDLLAATVDAPPGVVIRLEESAVGKGASADAVAVVIEALPHVERVASDLATIVGLGTFVALVIARLRKRLDRAPILNEAALEVLAVGTASVPASARFVGMVPITAPPGRGGFVTGTDERDIWAAIFQLETHDAIVGFMSPTGLRLGTVRVPAEMHWDGEQLHYRSAADVARFWASE